MPRDKTTHKQAQEEMERYMEKKLQEVKDNEQKLVQRQNAVRHLSRVPGNCPIGSCNEVVFPSNMMMHMLHKHTNTVGIISSEIYEHSPVVLCFDPTGYVHGVNNCMATLMYGGVMDKPLTQPGVSYLSNPNTALISDNNRFENYLPIMVMVCRTTWYAQLRDKHLERQLVSINADKAGIYVFWLVAPTTARKLYYTLTVYDRHYLNSRSVIRVVRDYTSYQNPSDFLPSEDNYLLLRDSEVNEFMNSVKASPNSKRKPLKLGIPIELILYEDPKNPPVRHSTQKELQEALEQVQEMYIKDTMPRTKASLKRTSMSRISLARKPRKLASNSTMASTTSRSIFYH